RCGICRGRAHPSFLLEEAGFFVVINGGPGVRRGAARRTGATGGYLALVGVCAASATGCGRERSGSAPPDSEIAVIDDAGRTVALDSAARRVISMIPAQTGIVAILSGPDALVARTRWDLDPRLAHLPSIGNALTPSVEWLVARRPDLVIAWPDAQSRDVVQRLDDIGIPVYASRVESVTQIR